MIASACLIAIVSIPASAASWRLYHNTRFGATGEVPTTWRMQPAPMNNDGRAFLSPDGKARITISGIFSTRPHAEEIADRVKPDDGETMTKTTSDGEHVRVEGVKGRASFVRVSILSCAGMIWNDLDITYPTDAAASYSATIAHAVSSFHPGRGYELTCKGS
jgi:hypothetical protein